MSSGDVLRDSRTPDWATDRCAECGTPEAISTHDVTKHPPLCEKCADLWYPPNPADYENGYDCRSVAA